MLFGVIRFPGSCDEVDAVLACERVPGARAQLLWHRDPDLHGVDAIVVPGGFSYGDYLRVGAIARFSPVMESVIRFAREGGLVLGICNGFQVLCEAGLLPGALLPNLERRFICRQVNLEVVQGGDAVLRRTTTPARWSRSRSSTRPAATTRRRTTSRRWSRDGQILLRYAHDGNPNGSSNDIAGVSNAAGNVFGLMPHPEHAVDPLSGSDDGLKIFTSMAHAHG